MNYVMTFVCVLGVVAAIETRAVAAQSPGTVLPIFIDYDAPPTDIGGLASAADAIAVVRIEAVRYESSADPKNGRTQDVTRYDVRVIDTVKPHAMLPQNLRTLTITRLGGQHSENGRVIRSAVRGFEDFQQNNEYLLFLNWNTHRKEFDITYGPNGSFQLVPPGTVKPLGRSDVATKQQGKDRAAFLNELRIASGR